VMPGALENRAQEIARGWAGSLTMGAGQFCTNSGITILPNGPGADQYVSAAAEALKKVGGQTMLTDGIAKAYREGADRFTSRNTVKPLLVSDSQGRTAKPDLFEISGEHFLAEHSLSEEVFGPLGLVVRASSADAMLELAARFDGQLTATIHMDDRDIEAAQPLRRILERKAGRVLVNGFPTGVEVVDSMVHGGPYPASTNFGATSVGTMSIRRFLRPVAYQNLPEALLPEDLRDMIA